MDLTPEEKLELEKQKLEAEANKKKLENEKSDE